MTITIQRVQTGVRIEKRLLKVLKALAEQLDMSLGDLLEGMALHCFDGKAHFSRETLAKIKKLKEVYELDLTAKEKSPAQRTGVMTDNADSQLLRRFKRLEFELGNFRHADHVQVAYDMLGRYDFVNACAR